MDLNDLQNLRNQGKPSGVPGMPKLPNFNVGKLIGIIFSLVFFLLVGIFVFVFFGFNFFGDIFSSGPLKGDVLDLTYVPENGGKLWVHTDGSFSFLQKMESPGSLSISTECFFCKTFTYIYDPITEEVLNEIEIESDGVPRRVEMFYENGNVWIFSMEDDSNEPTVTKYNAETGDELLDTDSFVAQHSEFSAGIVELRVSNNPKRLDLVLGDGLEFQYVIEDDKLFKDNKEMNDYYESLGNESITVFALVEAGSDARRQLYSLTGPKSEIGNTEREDCWSYIDSDDGHTLDFFCHSTASSLDEQIYLESVLLYQDSEFAAIFHQDRIGKGAKRHITAVGVDGKQLWSIPQEDLFPEVAFNADDPFSAVFYVKNNIDAGRYGDLFIFKAKSIGAIGFDFATGSKLWELAL